MTLSKNQALLESLRGLLSFADEPVKHADHPLHFAGNPLYIKEMGAHGLRYHLAHPRPDDMHGKLEDYADGSGRGPLTVFGWEPKAWDGSEFDGLDKNESRVAADVWGVANQADLVARLTASHPDFKDIVPDITVEDQYSTSSSAWDSFIDNDVDEDSGYGAYQDERRIAREVPVREAEEDEDESDIPTKTEYYDHTTGEWGEDVDYEHYLAPEVTVRLNHPVLGNMTRTMKQDEDGGKQAVNDYWQASAPKGSDLSSIIYQSQMEAYRVAGADEVQVHANITTGGYLWAQHGFDCDTDGPGGEVKRELNDLWDEYGGGQFSDPDFDEDDLEKPMEDKWREEAGDRDIEKVPDDEFEEIANASPEEYDLRAYRRHAQEGRYDDATIGAHLWDEPLADMKEYLNDYEKPSDVVEMLARRDREIDRINNSNTYALRKHADTVATVEKAKQFLEEHPDKQAYIDAALSAPDAKDRAASMMHHVDGYNSLDDNYKAQVDREGRKHLARNAAIEYGQTAYPLAAVNPNDPAFAKIRDNYYPHENAEAAGTHMSADVAQKITDLSQAVDELKNHVDESGNSDQPAGIIKSYEKEIDRLQKHHDELHKLGVDRYNEAEKLAKEKTHAVPDKPDLKDVPEKFTAGEDSAAIRYWMQEALWQQGAQTETGFTQDMYDDMFHQINHVGSMHELSNLELPPESGVPDDKRRIGKNALSGSDWWGTYDLHDKSGGDAFRAGRIKQNWLSRKVGAATAVQPAESASIPKRNPADEIDLPNVPTPMHLWQQTKGQGMNTEDSLDVLKKWQELNPASADDTPENRQLWQNSIGYTDPDGFDTPGEIMKHFQIANGRPLDPDGLQGTKLMRYFHAKTGNGFAKPTDVVPHTPETAFRRIYGAKPPENVTFGQVRDPYESRADLADLATQHLNRHTQLGDALLWGNVFTGKHPRSVKLSATNTFDRRIQMLSEAEKQTGQPLGNPDVPNSRSLASKSLVRQWERHHLLHSIPTPESGVWQQHSRHQAPLYFGTTPQQLENSLTAAGVTDVSPTDRDALYRYWGQTQRNRGKRDFAPLSENSRGINAERWKGLAYHAAAGANAPANVTEKQLRQWAAEQGLDSQTTEDAVAHWKANKS